MPAALDTVDLAQRLIRCPSVTPAEGGALDLLQEVLEGLGFTCHRLPFSEPGTADVDNLYARIGSGASLCYAGHTDVVPVGDAAAWSCDPFGGELRDGWLYGRGAVDMKGSIAAFVAALGGFLARRGSAFDDAVSLLITGDEEDVAINGTRKMLHWLTEQGEELEVCLVGEPTSNERLGDMIKIGRRGSMNGELTVHGIQGHTAYPQLARNPLHDLVPMLQALIGEPLDQGNAHFPPSGLQITTVDVGNPVSNVIPAQASAAFNIRFNDQHSSETLTRWLRERLAAGGAEHDLEIRVSGESFLCPPGRWSDLLSGAVAGVTGIEPELGTTGGTSDARFIKDHATVAELGLLNATAHKVDERVSLTDLQQLTEIYGAVLDGYFSS